MAVAAIIHWQAYVPSGGQAHLYVNAPNGR